MKDSTIDGLRAALEHSPDNLPLRLMLAENLLEANRIEEAEAEFTQVVQQGDDPRAKKGLAQVFFRKANYSACNVILEDLIGPRTEDVSLLVLYARALLRENSLATATSIYQRVLLISPAYEDEELDGQLRRRGHAQEPESQGADDRFLEKPDINFSDVGGLAGVKREIDLKIIKPMLHPELYKAYGKKIGGGMLLYGPPGCGKTYIAKATAGQANARFINVGLNDILDMWIGNSEKNLHEIFDLARSHTPCVLFIDEIDALGASRTDMKQSAGRNLINQFLQELDGIADSNEGVLVLGATNAPWNLDPAFRRPGRFDRIVFVPPPDQETRAAILDLKLQNKPTEKVDTARIANKTAHYSGADLDAIIDIAIEEKLEAAFEDGITKPLTTHDLLQAVSRHRPSTQEWFATARNYALYANETGLYDDILAYLKIKK